MKWLQLAVALPLLAAVGICASRILSWQAGPAADRAAAARSWRRTPWLIGMLLALLGAGLLLRLALPQFSELPADRLWHGVLYSLVGAAIFCTMLWRAAPLWSYLLLLLFFAIPQFQSSFYTLFHSFLHYSITYELYLRGFAPENPLMAGEPLRYMYGVHALIAWLMRVLPLSPPVLFAALDGLGMLVFALVVERIMRQLNPDPSYRVLGTFVAIVGLDIFVYGPLWSILGDAIGQRRFGAVVSLQKFTGINTNQVGLICMAFAVLAVVRLALRSAARWRSLAMLFGATMAAGYFYQPAFLAIGYSVGAAAGVALIWPRAGFFREGALVWATLALAALASYPMLVGVSSGTPDDPAIQIWRDWPQFKANLKFLIVHLSLPALLCLVARDHLRRRLRELPVAYLPLAVMAASLWALYLVIYLRFNNEYKLLGFASVAMAPIGAVLVQHVFQRQRVAFAGLIVLMLLSVMTDFSFVTLRQPLTDPVSTDGRRIRHLNPDEEALYHWIWEQTPTNGVFVDSLLTIPAIAGRQLYVGLDIGRDPEVTAGRMHNGWLIDANVFQRRIMEVDRTRLALREQLATAALTGEAPLDGGLIAQLRATSPSGRPLFFVVRGRQQIARFEAFNGLQRVYSGNDRNVYRLHD